MVAIPSLLLGTGNSSAITSTLGILNRFTRSAEALGGLAHIGSVPLLQKLSNGDNTHFASIRGPVLTSNFPDPAILHVDGVSYAFATRDRNRPIEGRAHVQVATSRDNSTWTVEDGIDALPQLGEWETGGAVWAPDIVKLAADRYVLYYSDVPKSDQSKHCIGAAISTTPKGPYIPLSSVLVCPDPKTLGGAIDPEGFFDYSTNKRYLIYKVDGNSLGHGGLCSNSVKPIVPTPLMLQEVDVNDGVTLIGGPIELFRQDEHNGPLIEAPAMHRSREGFYFLFYSSNCFTTSGYDVEYATATSITGPWVKNNTRLLHTGDGPSLVGPGGMDIVAGQGNLIVFHGILSVDNSKAFRKEVQSLAKRKGVSIDEAAKQYPLVRGMYVAKAKFKDRHVSLG